MPKAHTTNIPNIKVQDQIGTAISAIMYGAGGADGAGGTDGAGGDGLQNNTPRWTLRVLRGVINGADGC